MTRKKKSLLETLEENTKTYKPPFDLGNPSLDEEPKEEKEKTLVRCPDCPWKAGLKDENTYCETCNGSGQVGADPLE